MNLSFNKKNIFIFILILCFISFIFFFLFKNKKSRDTYKPREINNSLIVLDMLVVCSSPEDTSFPREIRDVTNILQIYYGKEVAINPTFIRVGLPVKGPGYISGLFPRDVEGKFDVIWFSGCNLLYNWVVGGKYGKTDKNLLKFKNFLDEDGIFFFTETPSFKRLNNFSPFVEINDLYIHEVSFPYYQSEELENFYKRFPKMVESVSDEYPYIFRFRPEIEEREEKRDTDLIVCTKQSEGNEIPQFFEHIPVAGDGWCFYRSVLAADKLNLKQTINTEKLKQSIIRDDEELPLLTNFLDNIQTRIFRDFEQRKEYTQLEENFLEKVIKMTELSSGFGLKNWGDASISGNVISEMLDTNILIYRKGNDGTCILYEMNIFPQPYQAKTNTIFLLREGSGSEEHYSVLRPVNN